MYLAGIVLLGVIFAPINGGAATFFIYATSFCPFIAETEVGAVKVMDATALTFREEFDAVFSNAALHWMKNDPDGAIISAYRALRRPGRFVGEMGGHACVGAIIVALHTSLEKYGVHNPETVNPWHFPTIDEYRERLERVGFVAESVQRIPRPTPLPTGMRGWLETFANPFCAVLPKEERDKFLDQVTATLKPVLCEIGRAHV